MRTRESFKRVRSYFTVYSQSHRITFADCQENPYGY